MLYRRAGFAGGTLQRLSRENEGFAGWAMGGPSAILMPSRQTALSQVEDDDEMASPYAGSGRGVGHDPVRISLIGECGWGCGVGQLGTEHGERHRQSAD